MSFTEDRKAVEGIDLGTKTGRVGFCLGATDTEIEMSGRQLLTRILSRGQREKLEGVF